MEADDVEATTSGFCCISGVSKASSLDSESLDSEFSKASSLVSESLDITSGVCCLGGVSTSIVLSTCGFGDDC